MNKWLTSTVDAYNKTFGKTKTPVVYEVGSRDGLDGHELALRIYDGYSKPTEATIVLFECNPPQIEYIKRNYPNAILITDAISDKKGTVDFLQIHGDMNMVGSSTMNTHRNDTWIKETSTIKVNTIRLDEVIENLGHQKIEIDIMKIDIEGYSYSALKSLGKYLRNIKIFHVETEIKGYARAETNLDIELFMRGMGYKLVSIDEEWAPQILDHVYVRVDI